MADLAEFAAFILTHGRPEKVHTLAALRKHGYTGRVFIVVDDGDATREQYLEKFGAASVLVFSKAEIAATFDEGDNFRDRRSIVYARNACFSLARSVGARYFIQLDDDYTDFRFKVDPAGGFVDRAPIRDLDAVFAALLEFYKRTPALSVAMAQGGDFIGGRAGSFADGWGLRRKCMNTFVCSIDRPFSFVGRINEDVNTYTETARRGGLFLTVPAVAIQQKQTQKTAGGMTELYLDAGTYVKSFYSVMYAPSCVRIAAMGSKHRRIHHRVDWGAAVPMILDERTRKRPRLEAEGVRS